MNGVPPSPRARRLARFAAFVPLAALVLFAPPLFAQSYLSEWPDQPSQPSEAGGAPSGTAGERQAGLAQRTLDDLFREVARGNGRVVYPELAARFQAEMLRAAADPLVDAAALHKTYLINLLRAGDGVAPLEEQERTARLFTEYYPDDEHFPAAFFYLNQALFKQGKPLVESFFFDAEALASLPAWVQTRYLTMLARSEERKGEYARAAHYLLAEKESRATLQQTSQADVEEVLERLATPVALLAFLEDHPEVGWLYRREPFLVAKALLNAGQLDQALLKLEEMLARGQATTAADLKLVNDLKSEIKAQVATRADRIGVLLPLGSASSVLRELAVETLEGLRMAVQFPGMEGEAESPLGRLLAQDLPLDVERGGKPGRHRPPRYELVIRDTGNSPETAADQVEALVRDDQVVAIIGPIARAESTAAAAKAEELKAPLISFSLSLDIPPGARFIFRHSKSQEEEIRDLVRYATDYLHLRRFAILYPDTGYGQSMMRLFWDEVMRLHGQVVAASAFEPTVRVTRHSRAEVGLKEIFERFTGVDRHLTPEEQALLDAVGDSRPDPIVDFDGLFIPIGPEGIQDLQLIAPYPVTVDAEHVQLLGTRFWNDGSVLVAGDGKLEGAVFVDAFDLSSTNPKVAAFNARHRAFFGHHLQYRPPSYYTGLGFDTANLLMALLQEPAHRTRKALREALVTMKPFFGVTGWTRFLESGESTKESMFFRIKDNDIQRLLP
jgi:ABC-type branched-subunit amino acid transport system substrate-binding protein